MILNARFGTPDQLSPSRYIFSIDYTRHHCCTLSRNKECCIVARDASVVSWLNQENIVSQYKPTKSSCQSCLNLTRRRLSLHLEVILCTYSFPKKRRKKIEEKVRRELKLSGSVNTNTNVRGYILCTQNDFYYILCLLPIRKQSSFYLVLHFA